MKKERWHESLKRLVYETPAKEIMAPWLARTTKFPAIDHLPMVPTGRVTLVGDSAHAMPIEKGLGGNNVLEDARLLSALIAAAPKPIDWLQVIKTYETEMFARAKMAIQESENAAEYFRKLRASSRDE